MNSQKSVRLEKLEERTLMSANSVTMAGGVVNIVADPNHHHTATVSTNADGSTQVTIDKQNFTFQGATQVNYFGGAKGDKFTNLTSLGGILSFGSGNNVVNSKAAGETIIAGDGNNFVQDFAPGNTISVGNGNNNVYGGPGDMILAGSGRNIIYDILGTNTISVAAHEHRDYIFTSASSTVNGAEAQDRVATFFAANRAPGSGTLVLEHGTLYFTANANGDTYVLNQVGNKLIATYNLNDGTGIHTAVFNRSAVKLVANFGGAGNDMLINNTDIPDVQYGAGGNNFVEGGTGALDLEKAGGASGSSVVIGRSPNYNDLTASLSPNATATLITNPQARKNVVRSQDANDLIFGLQKNNGVYIGPVANPFATTGA